MSSEKPLTMLLGTNRSQISKQRSRGSSEAARAMIELFQEASPLPPSFPAALCRAILYEEDIAGADRDLFFPDKFGKQAQGTRSPQDTARLSKDICNGTGERVEHGPCPHRAECAVFAIGNKERFGVWGGMSERERMRLRKTMGVQEEERQEQWAEKTRVAWEHRGLFQYSVDLVLAPDWMLVVERGYRYALVAGHRYRVHRMEWTVEHIETDGSLLEVVGKAQGDTYKQRRRDVRLLIIGHARESDGDGCEEEAG